MKKNKNGLLPEQPDPTKELVIDKGLINLAVDNPVDSLKERYNENSIKIIAKIAYNLSVVGLSLEDSCTICSVDTIKFMKLMERDKDLKKFIDIKSLEYKKKLQKTITDKASKGDEKLAMWLLEKQYTEEFGSIRNKKGKNQEEDFISQAVKFIQSQGDTRPLVDKKNGEKAVIRIKGKEVREAEVYKNNNAMDKWV